MPNEMHVYAQELHTHNMVQTLVTEQLKRMMGTETKLH